jgi:hypothetical protein
MRLGIGGMLGGGYYVTDLMLVGMCSLVADVGVIGVANVQIEAPLSHARSQKARTTSTLQKLRKVPARIAKQHSSLINISTQHNQNASQTHEKVAECERVRPTHLHTIWKPFT